MAIIRDWIEPGTTVISDCWGAYRDLQSQGFTHRTVNHSIAFVDPLTGAHTNTIERTWRTVKVFLGQYNRGEDYEYHFANYMFAARCKAEGVPMFLQFLHLVANTDWSKCRPPRLTAPPHVTFLKRLHLRNQVRIHTFFKIPLARDDLRLEVGVRFFFITCNGTIFG
jgi:hypothetical protein